MGANARCTQASVGELQPTQSSSRLTGSGGGLRLLGWALLHVTAAHPMRCWIQPCRMRHLLVLLLLLLLCLSVLSIT